MIDRCPICEGPSRETVGMVCQTCGRDYGATCGELRDRLAAVRRLHVDLNGRCVGCLQYWPCSTALAGEFT